MSPNIASETMGKSIMGLAAESSDMFSYFLRDKIYSDKHLACIREYVCNAVDEHVKYNIKQPVEVTLKSVNNDIIWSVRDYAKGLNEHDIRNIFGMYGRSTKSNSNEFIGCYGIGSKAAHCYTDTFYIESHFENVRTLYACVLGGGDKGVPVGELYKISEEPTDESGLEIYFTVKHADAYTFNSKTAQFITKFGKPDAVKYSTLVTVNTYSSIPNRVVTPAEPFEVIKRDGFTFNAYKSDDGSLSKDVQVRMGGVVYKNSMHFPHAIAYPIIVDVPIGKLSIPISREYMEDTAANNDLVDKIKNALIDIRKETLSKIPKLKLGEFFKSRQKYNFTQGWFCFNTAEFYSDEYNALRCFKNLNVYNSNTPTYNGNVDVYVHHSKHSRTSWEKRLIQHLKPSDNVLTIMDYDKDSLIADHPNVDMSDITFVNIRDVGIPAVKRAPSKSKDDLKFNVTSNRGKTYTVTAEELEKMVSDTTKLVKNWWKTVDNFDDLRTRSITTNSAKRGFGYYTRSTRMVKALVKIGWLDIESSNYESVRTRILQRIEDDRKKETIKQRIQNMFFTNVSPLTIQSIYKHPHKVIRLERLHKAIIKENSTRGRIIQKLVSQARGNELSRQDFRNLLSLKD